MCPPETTTSPAPLSPSARDGAGLPGGDSLVELVGVIAQKLLQVGERSPSKPRRTPFHPARHIPAHWYRRVS